MTITIYTLFYFVLHILTEGMWLWGVPDEKEVESVSISYPSLTETVRTFDDDKNKELALNLTNFLKYVPLKKADTSEAPLITISYFTYDEETYTVSANNETVWWKDKAYTLKDDETFINLAEGIFFLEYID